MAGAPGHPRWRTVVLRIAAVGLSLTLGLAASLLYLQYSQAIGLTFWSALSAGILFFSTTWLAWGATLALVGLWPGRRPAWSDAHIRGRTAILVPICNEDASAVFARVAAMMDALRDAPADLSFAILSDTQDPRRVEEEARCLDRLMREGGWPDRVFYRRRMRNTGRKAGNLADFFRQSGAAFDYALILDADSLMAPATVLEMIRRMEAEPRLALLQSLPVVVRARSVFGRAMQFSAGFYSPAFTRGLARLQGRAGPFWGHNALVRSRAWAQCCALPELAGKPPFGGHILSHDVIEGALLARGGWVVRVDTDLGGSYEEGPETVLDHARRDRRWCQGNLQHSRAILARGLLGWSRLSIFLGIFSYLAPLFWVAFMVSVGIDRATDLPPVYFPDAHQIFPVFPADATTRALSVAIGIIGLLILPKLLILVLTVLEGRARSFGGGLTATLSTVADIVLSSLLAPVLMCFQIRAVLEVLRGADGGWPASNREGAVLGVGEAARACRFILISGIAGGIAVWVFVPHLMLWLLPVLGPMALSPLLVAWTSHPATRTPLFRTPQERARPAILAAHDAVHARWLGRAEAPGALPGRSAPVPQPVRA